MDFPVEIWMRIFELMEPNFWMVIRPHPHILDGYNEVYAEFDRRPTAGKSDATLETMKVELEAAKQLREFELLAWKETRPLYQINRNSRTAAIKTRTAGRLLNASRPALRLRIDVPIHETDEEESLYDQIRGDRMSKGLPPPVIWPHYCRTLRDYAVVALPSACFCNTSTVKCCAAYEATERSIEAGTSALRYWTVESPERRLCALRDLLLHTKHLVIVGPWSNDDGCVCPTAGMEHLAGMMRHVVKEFWRKNGILNKFVEVLD